ncbi:hypothetical protein FRC12_013578 [Ceratobasidium sp. 428]|nr:hypothetical protein FRC12_013578 [Ceratobasidium sp. 428]
MSTYACAACTYTTNINRSYRSHTSQCDKLRKLMDSNKQTLERKRKNLDSGIGGSASINLIRASKRIFHVDHEVVSVPQYVEPAIELPDIDHAQSPPLAPNVLSPCFSAEPEQTSLSQPPKSPPSHTVNYPAYRPTFGSYQDNNEPLPEAPPAVLDSSPDPVDSPPGPRIRRVVLRVQPEPEPYTTACDPFGQYRIYPTKPEFIPDSLCELDDFSESQTTRSNPNHMDSPDSLSTLIAPCPNVSTFRLQHWHWNEGLNKTANSRNSLVQNVLLQPDFTVSDLAGVTSWKRLDDSIANYSEGSASSHNSVAVSLVIPPRTPAAALDYAANPTKNVLSVSTTKSLTLLDAVKSAFTKNKQRFFHYTPYQARCRDPKTSEDFCSYGEVYESQKMLDHHREIQDLVLEQPCNLPRCAAEAMLFSDATTLADFGPAKAWPIRLTFGNISKYERSKPSLQNHFEVGYFPTLPIDIQDQLRKLEPGRPIPKTLLTHLRRELFHQVLLLLLDDEFLRAWRHGVVIVCADGITRRVFPRLFSYAADYPEKLVLLATIRGMKSMYPCPRCLMPKSEFKNLGLASDFIRRQKLKRVDNEERAVLVDLARLIIFDEGRTTNSKRVEELLKPNSYVPNAFSSRLRYLGFDIFDALTVDFLHEFELGVWKSVFLHLLRILHSTSSSSVSILNERFRLIPPFGADTIRPFSEDVSDMSRPAARNYEDILQCIHPAIEGLLPASIESQVLTLLYVLAQWHGLAKLRRSTSLAVKALKHTTTRLGHELREFEHSTSELTIYETPKEHSARQQRARKKARPRAALDANDESAEPAPAENVERRRKFFNLETIKVHSLGDYPETIENRGTSDSFSTQTGELLHRNPKKRYVRTNGRDYLPQMERIRRIETRLNDIKSDLDAATRASTSQGEPAANPVPTAEDISTHDGRYPPYRIAASQKNPVVLPDWRKAQASDPATKACSISFRLVRGENYQGEEDRTPSELSTIHFQYDRIYSHQTLQIHYTTYDVRRGQDTVNPSTPKRFILVRSDEPDCPGIEARRFWYAKVLGIYHANVSYNGSRAKRMDFLWVRWLSRMTDMPGGWETCRLDQVRYFQDSSEFHAFDFVDPADVVRAAHLIPGFAGKQTIEYLGSANSLAADQKGVGDWKYHYIARFADRDMLMRFTGMAIGHTTLSNASDMSSGLPEQDFNLGYEFSDEDEPEACDNGRRNDKDGAGEDDQAEDDEVEDDEDESEDESDCEQMTDNEADGVVDGEYEASW